MRTAIARILHRIADHIAPKRTIVIKADSNSFDFDQVMREVHLRGGYQ